MQNPNLPPQSEAGIDMKAILADTGPLYAAYDPSDQFHTQALAEIDFFANQNVEVLIPYPVFLEAHSLVLKRLGIPIGLRLLEELSAGATLIQPLVADYGAAQQTLHQFPDQAITLCDATTAAIARRLIQPVWTYDFHFDIMQVTVQNQSRI
jgi:uncharacterized protein